MKLIKKILKITGGMMAGLLCICLINTITVKSKQADDAHIETADIDVDMDRASQNLSKALQFKTISYTDPQDFDYSEFLKLHQFIDESYPEVRKNLSKEVINNYSLLYTWRGSNTELKPLILCAHTDVVGVEEETLDQWKYEPFSGDIAEGKIWGRGARDNKCQVFAILEAVEYLLEHDYQPERTIYLAFGHDEEVLGENGAGKIAQCLEERGIEAECLIDEGGAIVEGAVPGVHQKTALIGTAEKGYMTLKLSTDMDGGHSSDPEDEYSISVLNKALDKINEYSFADTIDVVKPMFEFAASEADFPMKSVYANLSLTQGILKNILSQSAETNSMIRTTKAATVFNSGFKDNVIPSHAEALINFRLMPGEKIEDTKEKIINIIDDERVKVELYGYYNEAPEISSTDSESFRNIQKSLKEVFPDSISVPYFLSGGTDSKHYTNITDNIYRVTPSLKEKDEVGHGVNERIQVDNYKQYIEVSVQLIKNI